MEAPMPLMASKSHLRIAAFVGRASLLLCATGGVAAAAEPTKDQCIDANETAQTLRKTAKLREAEQRLLVCVAPSCPGPVRDDCAQRLTEVRAAIPTIVFAVKDDADQDLTAVTVTMDGAALVDKLDGTALAVDPGEHHFAFEAEGRVKEEKTLLLRESEKDRHERIVLVAAPAASLAPAPEGAPLAAESPPPKGQTQRIAGLAVGGAGGVAVVIGSVLGIVAKSTYDTAFGTCTGGNTKECTPQGVKDDMTAHSQAAVATGFFVAGAALLGGGAALYFTAPKETLVSVGPAVGDRSAGLELVGRW
jgi:hypothetical protein